ncbi:EF-hand domain-containing protein [Nocardia abscessus]|uniref:EF-hand domain-containing protein n=1 Tax=Nocardia abscessus TaxID=120957 RepID=UPI002453D580|nr:EF-hand domain-containing protein [Nocardia abscessus]
MSDGPVDTFGLWDRDGDGLVSVEDITAGIRALGLEVDDAAVERLVAGAPPHPAREVGPPRI